MYTHKHMCIYIYIHNIYHYHENNIIIIIRQVHVSGLTCLKTDRIATQSYLQGTKFLSVLTSLVAVVRNRT